MTFLDEGEEEVIPEDVAPQNEKKRKVQFYELKVIFLCLYKLNIRLGTT